MYVYDRNIATIVLILGFNVIDFGGTSYKLNMFLLKTGSKLKGVNPGLQSIVFLEFLSNTLRVVGGVILGLLVVGGNIIDD